jgi:hypothetical protein
MVHGVTRLLTYFMWNPSNIHTYDNRQITNKNNDQTILRTCNNNNTFERKQNSKIYNTFHNKSRQKAGKQNVNPRDKEEHITRLNNHNEKGSKWFGDELIMCTFWSQFIAHRIKICRISTPVQKLRH